MGEHQSAVQLLEKILSMIEAWFEYEKNEYENFVEIEETDNSDESNYKLDF